MPIEIPVTRKGGKNIIVELLRFACALVVVLFHTRFMVKNRSLSDGFLFFSTGSCAVEFFFVLSGFLMARSISQRSEYEETSSSLGDETFNFIFTKMCRLWPHVLLSCAMILCVEISVGRMTLLDALFKVWTCLSELLFVHMSGFSYGMINGHFWYLSALILSVWLLYPIARSRPNLFNLVIAPLVALFLIGWMVQINGGVGRPVVRSGIIFNGLIRSLAEVCAGCFCYAISRRLSANRNFIERTLPLLFLWFICVVVAFCWMWQSFGGSVFHLLILFCIIITLSFSMPVFEIKNNASLYKFCKWLGALSLPIYIHQNWAIRLGNVVYPVIDTFSVYLKGVAVVLLVLLPFSMLSEFFFRKFFSRKSRCI